MTKLTYLESDDFGFDFSSIPLPMPEPEFYWASTEAETNDVLSLPIPKIEHFWMDLGFLYSYTEVNTELIIRKTEVITREVESKIAECDVPSASLLRPGLVRRLGCGVSLPPSLVSLNP